MSTDPQEPAEPVAPDLGVEDALMATAADPPPADPPVDPPADPPPTDPKPPEPGDPPPAPAPEPSPEPTPAPAPAPPNIRQLVQSEWGVDMSPYQSDYEAIRAMVEAKKLVGVRNDDAVLGRAIRDSGREGDVRAILSGQQPQPPQPPAPEPEAPVSIQELRYLATQVTRDESGRLVPVPGAAPDAANRFQQAEERYQAQIDRVVTRPEEVVAPVIQKQLAEFQSQIQRQWDLQQQQARQAQEIAGWAQQNASWLFNGGNPQQDVSPQGRQCCQLFDRAVSSGMPPNAALEYATAVVRSQQPQQPPPPQPKPQATRQPAVGTPPAETEEQLEKRLQDMDIVEALIARAEHDAAIAGTAG
jgi:hypothetical protein